MRICFLSRRYFPAISGMSVYARNMTKALSDLGHDITMLSQYREDIKGVGIYGGGPPPREPWMEVIGLRSLGEEMSSDDVPADFELDINAMISEALALHAIRPFDIVHAQYCYPNGLAALEISRRLNIPNVVSIQGGDGHWVGLCCSTHKAAMHAVLHSAMALLIGSKSFAEEVMENHGIGYNRFTILPGATDVGKFAGTRPLGKIHRPVRLLYHGRVDRRKGVLDFIQASYHLRASGKEIKILVSGIGPDVAAAKNLVKELGLEDLTRFLGSVGYGAVQEVYRQGDIFISPTYAEGFSNTILEAMAAGLPIISCDVVGVKDCLEHNVNGLLVEAGNVMELSNAMLQLIKDEAMRNRLAKQGLKDVERKYSWQVVAAQIQKVYGNLIGQLPENSWAASYDITTKVVDADMSCRFRKEPHLL